MLVYQSGKAQVDRLETVRFVRAPSHGGKLLGGGQMSSLCWLAAGATANCGAVGDPCSRWQKFPSPGVLLRPCLNGDSAIEAYWKSAAWPARGVFIGEPLAAPFQRRSRTPVR